MKKSGLVLLILGLAPSLAFAEPDIIDNTQHYEVSGTSLYELGQQGIHGVHLKGWNRMRPVGLSESEVRWSFNLQPVPEGCVIEQVHVAAEIVTSLPKWNEKDRARSSKETQAGWLHYLAALESHEREHKDITLDVARAIEKQLGAIPAMEDCDKVDKEANVRANKLMDRHKELQEEYDRVTNHGETQGVRLH